MPDPVPFTVPFTVPFMTPFRSMIRILVILFLCPFLCVVQGQGEVAVGGAPTLKLELRNKSAVYCSSSELLLTLELVFENEGRVPILLQRHRPVVWVYRVRSQVDRLRVEETKSFVDTTRAFDMRKIPTVGDFETIPVNGKHAVEIKVYEDLTDGSADSEGDLEVGDYSIEINVSTWYFNSAFVDEYRKKWAEKGFLWTKELWSSPAPFKVEPLALRKAVQCEE